MRWKPSACVALLCEISTGGYAQNYLITTVAGGGLPITPAAATTMPLNVAAIVTGAHGNIYFTASSYVFQMNSVGVVTRVAGTSSTGYSGDGGFATNAQIDFGHYSIKSIAVDASGNVYIADSDNGVIRKVTAATGIIATVAGTAKTGSDTGDGGPAANAGLETPSSIAVDGFGNLYIAEGYDGRVRKVSAGTGIITTVVGTGGILANDTGDGGLATAATLAEADDVAVDGFGNLYIMTVDRVRKVDATTGIITTVAGTGGLGYSGDGGPAIDAQFEANSLAVDGAGNIYIADLHNRIRKVTASTGIITTVAGNGAGGYSGDGGPATSAELRPCNGVAVDGESNLYIADGCDSVIRKVSATNATITTVAGNGQTAALPTPGVADFAQLGGPASVAIDAGGNVYFGDSNMVWKLAPATGVMTKVAGTGVTGYSGDGGPAATATFNGVGGIAVDSSGNLYIADVYNDAIRKVTVSTGVITTFAGPASNPALNSPSGVAVDKFGNIYAASFSATNQSLINILKVSPTGAVTTIYTVSYYAFAIPPQPMPVFAVDSSGNLYIGNGYIVQKFTAANGTIAAVAGTSQFGYSGDGGQATKAAIGAISGVAVDANGNLYIADRDNNVIRQVATNGIINTIAGTGPNTTIFSGDGGPATRAELSPWGVAVDSSGSVYIADIGNGRIRMLLPENQHPLLTISKTHAVGFTLGQANATYSISVGNAANSGTATGPVTVTETIPAGLTLDSMSGSGWSCSSNGTCARTDSLRPGSSYEPVTVVVNVAQDGPSQAVNQVTLVGRNAVATAASDTTGILPNAAQRATVTTVSAASGTAPVTSDSIVSMYALNIATAVSAATAMPPAPLPTALGNISAMITDSSGKTAPIGLMVVTPDQVNAVLPPNLAPGVATVDLISSAGVSITGDVSLVAVAPSLFTADESGHGVAAAQEVIAHQNGSQTFISAIATCKSSICTATPISLESSTDQAILELFGTGIRGAGGTASVSVTVGDAQGTVLYAGPQGGGGAGSYYGLDQVNVLLPRSLVGAGTTNVVLTAGGQPANSVTVDIE